MLTFKPITLAANHGDEEAVLVLDGERLMAVASRLGDAHEDAAGQWFVEAIFDDRVPAVGQQCASLDELADLIGQAGQSHG